MKTQNALEKIKHCSTNKEKIKLLVELCPSGFVSYLKNAKKFAIDDLAKWIIDKTHQLNDSVYTWQTRVFWILHDITEFPKCEICGNSMINCNVKSAQKGYESYICANRECRKKHKSLKYKSTMLSTHGYANNFQNPSVLAKIKQRNIETYGNACPANNKIIRKQIEDDNLKKYGVKSYSSTQECKDKVKATNLKNLGVENPFKSTTCRNKAKQTMLNTLGVDHPSKSKEIQRMKKQRLIEKYGENYSLVLWGNRGNVGQNKRSYNEFILNSSKVIPLFSLDEFLKKRQLGEKDFKFECKTCHKTFTSNWNDGFTRSCPYCMNSGCSNEEQELYDFLLTFLPDNEIKHNDRTVLDHLELDFFVPNKHKAIEFDGLFWHNDDMQLNYKYHLNKTEQCEAKGIQLIHVFENEWMFKRDIVKSRIKAMFGFYDNVVFARKCSISRIDNDFAKDFLIENHIQGSVNAQFHYGLSYDGKLISLMSFGKSRFSSKYEWELLRFCNKLGYHIPGAASKLLTFFERSNNPKSLISYADRRWSQGKLYDALGFKLDHVSPPDYWYFNDYSNPILRSRLQFQKHTLKTCLKNFDESKTEVENMKMNGYHRIFDCGNLVYVKTYV